MKDIDETLSERGNRYGEFAEHARITQNLKRAMTDSPKWGVLTDDMREALEMVQHKIGRILNGDPAYHDSWHDIVGYAKLVADRLLPSAAYAPRQSAQPREIEAARPVADCQAEADTRGGSTLRRSVPRVRREPVRPLEEYDW